MADKSASASKNPAQSSTGNGEPSTSSTTPAPRVIGNLTKMGESARGGGLKMKFTPNMPIRNFKPEDGPTTKAPEPLQKPLPTQDADSNRGKGRGRGRGRGRGGSGAGRGGSGPEMVPAGPFAMGPVAAGLASVSRQGSSYRTAASGDKAGKSEAGIKAEHLSSLPRNRDQLVMDDTLEIYSDDDGEGVVDLEEVKGLDFMAPDALKREKRKDSKGKGRPNVKREPVEDKLLAESKDQTGVKNESQALDLSESEVEVELEDLQQDFLLGGAGDSMEPGQLYFFQFPDPFPTFELPEKEDPSSIARPGSPGKRVSFAEDVKPSSGVATPQDHLSGIIGQLEIHQSGAVRMKLANDISYDIFAATQPSFLQQAVVMDLETKRMNVLGGVTKRFIATPDIDALIRSADTYPGEKAEAEGMDIDQS